MPTMLASRDLLAEEKVRNFYDSEGWNTNDQGITVDALRAEDLRKVSSDYLAKRRSNVVNFLPQQGKRLLDAGSGPIQYPEYMRYSEHFETRVCLDISEKALLQAERKLGVRGEYVCSSIVDMPFQTDEFDAVVCMHTLYHIAQEQQETAVRQLLRVAKPGAPVVIIYSNAQRLSMRMKNIAMPWAARRNKRATQMRSGGPMALYYHAHPLAWWRRFEDEAQVLTHCWRSLTRPELKLLVPDNALGSTLLAALGHLEDRYPKLCAHLGAYPMMVLRKH